jgi:hypothetical protein
MDPYQNHQKFSGLEVVERNFGVGCKSSPTAVSGPSQSGTGRALTPTR